MTSEARQRKMADRVKVIVAETLEKRIKDPRLGFITVTDVRVTPDIREASVFYTVYGDEESRASTAAALESAKGVLRSEVGKQTGVKFTPTLEFIPDAIPETAAHLEELLKQAAVADAAVQEQAATATYAGDADPYRHPDEDDDVEAAAEAEGVTPSGLLVLDKPGGMTSHDVVARVRRALGTRKVGHAGTLDPMATGVLVIGVEKATRLLGHLALRDKEYAATIRLGSATVTDDREGEVIATATAEELRAVTDVAVSAALQSMVGAIEQRPSAVSAIKVDGRRAYDRVRAGEDVELPARQVTITRLDTLGVTRSDEGIDVVIEVECSTGTYVRAIARDLGDALGVGGHLIELRRTRVGPFTVANATDLTDLPTLGSTALIPMPEVARSCFVTCELPADQARAVRLGQRIPWRGMPDADPVALVDEDGDFLALAKDDGGLARYHAVLAAPDASSSPATEA